MSQIEHTCRYTDYFFDARTKEYREYVCDRQALDSGFCEFHDENFLDGNEEYVMRLFKIDIFELEDLQEGSIGPIGEWDGPTQELLCIGFHLPAIDLHGLRFHAPVYFVNTKFRGDVNFINLTFTSASFSGAEFSGKTTFSNLEFIENFIFSDVKLLNEQIDFQNVIFNQLSTFTRFNSKHASFLNCTFANTNFRESKFTESIQFLNTDFIGKSDFSGVQFDGNADFSNTTFSKNTNFKYTTFHAITKFHNVDFKDQKLVLFDGDLSNVSFKDTDTTRVKFDERVIWGKPDRYEIYDARELKKILKAIV